MGYIGTKPSAVPLTSADITDGIITSAKIADGTIATADLNTGLTVNLGAGAVGTPSLTTSGDTNTGIFFPSADTIAFTEGGTEAMRINSSGFVGIGASSPSAKLQIRGASETGVPTDAGTKESTLLVMGGFDGGGAGGTVAFGAYDKTFAAIKGRIDFSADNSSGNLDFHLRRLTTDTSFTHCMRIGSDGALILIGSTAQKATGTTWSNPSDTRLKDNKQNYTKGLNELLQINVKTWEWNGKAGTTQGDVGIGVIADEIETILPNTIDTYKAKLNENDTEQTDVKRFDATEITWLLLNSVKEQQAIIEELKARLTALENN